MCWIMTFPKFICWNAKSQYLSMKHCFEIGLREVIKLSEVIAAAAAAAAAKSLQSVWYNTMHWLFRQCWFNELCISSQCWHMLFYNIKKITFVNITTDLIRKVFKYRESVRFIVVDTSFPRLSFLLDSFHFISGNKYCQFFSLKRRAHFTHFRKCLPKLQVWIIRVCLSIVHSSKNSASWQKHLI